MKLNIYEKREIVKTYNAECYDLMTCTVEDILNVLQIDKLTGDSDMDLIRYVGTMLPTCWSVIKPLILDIFEGLTEEEMRNTRMKEVAIVIVEVVKYAFWDISRGITEKN